MIIGSGVSNVIPFDDSPVNNDLLPNVYLHIRGITVSYDTLPNVYLHIHGLSVSYGEPSENALIITKAGHKANDIQYSICTNVGQIYIRYVYTQMVRSKPQWIQCKSIVGHNIWPLSCRSRYSIKNEFSWQNFPEFWSIFFATIWWG